MTQAKYHLIITHNQLQNDVVVLQINGNKVCQCQRNMKENVLILTILQIPLPSATPQSWGHTGRSQWGPLYP